MSEISIRKRDLFCRSLNLSVSSGSSIFSRLRAVQFNTAKTSSRKENTVFRLNNDTGGVKREKSMQSSLHSACIRPHATAHGIQLFRERQFPSEEAVSRAVRPPAKSRRNRGVLADATCSISLETHSRKSRSSIR